MVVALCMSASVSALAQAIEPNDDSIGEVRSQQGWTLDDLVLAVANDLNQFWANEFAGTEFQYFPPDIFTGYTTTIQTACGPVEPINAVYCGGDHGIYYDVNLLQRILFEVGDYAVAAIIAHEWAHLVQNLIGILGAGFPTIVTELQADCLTGIYTISVNNRNLLDFGDIDEAARILFLFGDDLPLLHPNAHGSSQMRHESFVTGFQQGFDGCSVEAVAIRIDNPGNTRTPTPTPTPQPPTGGGDLSDFDLDSDCYIGDADFFAATDFWLASRITDIAFFDVLDAWIGQYSVCPFAAEIFETPISLIKMSSAHVNFELKRTANPTTLRIYDATGTLLFEQSTLSQKLSWNMMNQEGSRVANGIYFYAINNGVSVGKFVILR